METQKKLILGKCIVYFNVVFSLGTILAQKNSIFPEGLHCYRLPTVSAATNLSTSILIPLWSSR